MARPPNPLDPARAARIVLLKSRVQAGTYEVDAEAVADAILRNADVLDDRWFACERAEAANVLAGKGKRRG